MAEEVNRKMVKNFSGDDRLRACSRAFGLRMKLLRMLMDVGQAELARRIGGFRLDTMSRLERGNASTISLDLLAGLAQWADDYGISLAWLFGGQGKPDQVREMADWPEGYAGERIIRSAIRQARPKFLSAPEQVRRADIGSGPRVAADAGTREAARILAPGLVSRAAGGKGKWTSGFATVPPEAVPTSHDWNRRYVPVVGRIAAGAGLDATEASAHPPGWCGEFLAYENDGGPLIAIRVKGASMEPQYRDGDMIVADTSQPARSGVCCVLIETEGEREPVLKRLAVAGKTAVLNSTNPAFSPRRVGADKISGAYRIIDHLTYGSRPRRSRDGSRPRRDKDEVAGPNGASG